MQTKFDMSDADLSKTVYICPVLVSELPEEIQETASGQDALYAVHNADGERLALVNDRRLAFVIARQNDLAPVNVH